MKNAIKKLAAAVLLVTISLATLGMSAAAADVNFYGNTTAPFGFMGTTTYNVGSGRTITDFFGAATKNLSPGDTRTVTVRLNNTTTQNATFYLIATPLNEDEAAALTSDGSYFDGKTASDELLEQIGVVITRAATPNVSLYSGLMSGHSSVAPANPMPQNVLPIGTVTSGASATITVALTIPGTLDNGYQDTLAAVNWSFIAELADPPGGPIITYPPSPSTPTQPATPDAPPPTDEVIEDETPPLANYEPPIIDDEVEIGEEDVPLAEFEVVPETGDDRPGIFTFGTLAAASAAVIVVLLITGNKRGKKKNV